MDADQHQRLVDAALAARKQAYAKYSNFLVGAAVLTEGGEIFVGCNIENASYGLTICAERVAVASAISAGFRSFRALAVATSDGSTPCGACRQFLAEFCADLPLVLVRADDPQRVEELALGTLLPRTFRLTQQP